MMLLKQGEVRQIGIEVINQLNQDFIIDAADFNVLDSNEQILESGVPAIDGHKILTLFSAQKVGKYYVQFKYHIGPEIMISKVYIEVGD